MKHLLSLLLVVPALGFAQVGKLGAVEKSVLVSPPGSVRFSQARLNQQLFQDQHLRTLKRAKALIKFEDGAELRVNERTELVIQTAQELRKYSVSAGTVWVKAAKGKAVVVETPTLTAAVRGTEFEVDATGWVRVYEGTVEVGPLVGTAVAVEAGSQARIVDGQVQVKPIPASVLMPEEGGPGKRWWQTIVPGRENLTSSDSAGFTDTADALHRYAFLQVERRRDPLGTTYNRFRGRFDVQTEQDPLGFAVGLAAAAITARDLPKAVSLGGEVTPLIGMPSFTTARLDYQFTLGRGQVAGAVESRAYIRRSDRWMTYPLGLSNVTFDLGQGLSLFTGRFALTRSPSPLNLVGCGTLSDRMTMAGFAYDAGPESVLAGWTMDVDAMAPGRQPAVVGSYSRYALGAKFTLSGWHQTNRRKSHLGFGAVVPVVPGKFEAYGELAFREGKQCATVGIYLPEVFQDSDSDVFFEYQSHPLFGGAWTIYANHQISKSWSLLTHFQWTNRQNTCGAAFSVRF